MKLIAVIFFFLSLPAFGQADEAKVLKGQYEHIDSLLAQFHGKVVYIDFWASWCRPCLAMMPHSKKLQQKFVGKDVVFLYLGLRDKKSSWKQKMESLDMSGYHYLLEGDLARQAKAKFNVYALPHYSIVQKNGEIGLVQALSPDYEETEQDLRKLLEE